MINKYELITWPHPVLTTKSTALSVEECKTAETKELVVSMFFTMHNHGGIGLAANQVGVTKRIIVADISYLPNAKDLGFTKPKVFINPEVIETHGTSELEEGCLSFPEITMKLKRCDLVTVKALDIDGNEFIEEASGLYAHVLQHEIDHLNGTTIYDYMTNLRRDIVKRKLNKFNKKYQ